MERGVCFGVAMVVKIAREFEESDLVTGCFDRSNGNGIFC
jgi:hypothetical protein